MAKYVFFLVYIKVSNLIEKYPFGPSKRMAFELKYGLSCAFSNFTVYFVCGISMPVPAALPRSTRSPTRIEYSRPVIQGLTSQSKQRVPRELYVLGAKTRSAV